MNEVQRGWQAFDQWTVAEILKAKTRFVHFCLAAIMPKELYDLAAKDNQMDRCAKWAKENGYYWAERTGETRLMKGDIIAARFTPRIVGEGKEAHCEITATILGKQFDCVPKDVNN